MNRRSFLTGAGSTAVLWAENNHRHDLMLHDMPGLVRGHGVAAAATLRALRAGEGWQGSATALHGIAAGALMEMEAMDFYAVAPAIASAYQTRRPTANENSRALREAAHRYRIPPSVFSSSLPELDTTEVLELTPERLHSMHAQAVQWLWAIGQDNGTRKVQVTTNTCGPTPSAPGCTGSPAPPPNPTLTTGFGMALAGFGGLLVGNSATIAQQGVTLGLFSASGTAVGEMTLALVAGGVVLAVVGVAVVGYGVYQAYNQPPVVKK